MKSKIYYTNDLATFLNISDAALRNKINRKAWPECIPEPFRIGRKWAWKVDSVQEWLQKRSSISSRQSALRSKKPGRPKKSFKNRSICD